MRWFGGFGGRVLGLAMWAAVLSANGDDGQRDLVRVRQQQPEVQPLLRINAGGHTGSVRALAFTPDSTRLCSAGLDKDVQVWNLTAVRRDLKRVFLRERVLRWQVGRGLRGSIYALAAAPSDGLLAIGGYGAMGSLGEILLVDPVAGTLIKVLEGHRQTVCGLAFSPNGTWLASQDTSGAALLWKRGDWQPTRLADPDEKTYGAPQAGRIAALPKVRPLALVGNDQVVLATLVGAATEARLQWKLRLVSTADPNQSRTLETVHYGLVTALAATADGARLAAADLEGNLYVWHLSQGGPPDSLKPGATVLSLAFSPDGRSLAAGTAVGLQGAKSQLQVWNLTARQIVSRRSLPDHVYACAVSPDGKRVAYVGGQDNQVFLEALGVEEQPVELRGTGRRILKVAFAKQRPYHRIAFGSTFHDRGFNDSADLDATFDPATSSLGTIPIQAADWLPADWARGGWTVKPRADGTLQLFRGGAAKGTVSLGPQVPGLDEGRPRCYAWLPDRQGQPVAIVVGTDRQDSVYVCRLVEQGPCPILRHFRGHHDYVTSVGVSQDLAYVVSGSADGTVIVWSLAGCAPGPTTAGRWGAEFAVQEEQLVVKEVQPAGPLFRRGLQVGDVVTQIRWPATPESQAEKRPAAILDKLRDLPWGTQVVFESSRQGVARPAFQLLPAWQPLATLFVSTNQEWAFWTPEGYYDASMNGYRLFGWQVNRGLQALPDFYRADQFYKRLERPDVLQSLLEAGSLREAFKQAAVQPPPELHEALPEQISATPRVEILVPAPGKVVGENVTKVRARIQLPPDRKLLQAKVFANGVVGQRQPLIGQRELPTGTELTYEWDVPLPQDERDLIQVVAGTDAPTAAFGDVIIQRTAAVRAASPPKLHLLAVGINKYRDSEIQPLSYSVADAEAVRRVLETRSKGLYTLGENLLLTNQDVTPDSWQRTLRGLAQKLKEVAQPDDLLVLFLAGHGFVDEKSQKYYFVGYDLKLADYQKGDVASCISWDDFAPLADVPCRKLALLDTCHSGAIQPLRSRDLKAAVRALQDDVVFTITASTGEQRSAEKSEWGHGAFTKCLLEALEGHAGGAQPDVVQLNAVVAWVKQSVPQLTEGLQTPTAAPEDIFPFTAIPLTRIK